MRKIPNFFCCMVLFLACFSQLNATNLNVVNTGSKMAESVTPGSEMTGEVSQLNLADTFNGDDESVAVNGIVFSGTFGGTEAVDNVYTNPTGSESWAGFANEDASIYPLIFVDGGSITFDASSDASASIYFRFEKNPHPDTEPSFNTDAVEINGSGSYTVDVPSQGDNTFKSFLLYVTTADVAVTLSNVAVTTSGSAPVEDVAGCMDANADNYNADAVVQAEDQWGNIACNYSSCDDIPDAEGCYYAENYSAFNEGFNADNCVQYGGTACTADGGADDGSSDEPVEAGTTYCGVQVTHFNIEAETPSAVLLSISNVDANSAVVTATSANDDPIDALIIGAQDDVAGVSAPYIVGGVASVTLTWADGAPASTSFELLWSKESTLGNWMLRREDLPTINTTEACEFVEGCMDANASNYNADADQAAFDQYGNSVCVYASCDDIPDEEGCVYADGYSAFHADFTATNCTTYGGTACELVSGCLDANASNYNPDAEKQALDQYGNLVCIYNSCEDVPASGGCVYPDGFGLFVVDGFNADQCAEYGGVACTAGCIDANATNFDATAAVAGIDQYNNSVCVYASCDDIPDAEGCVYGDAYATFYDGFNAANCVEYGGTACTLPSGCLDANASNYDADAAVQAEDQWGNLLCVYASCDEAPGEGCVYAESFGEFAEGFGPSECSGYGGTPCTDEVHGCTDTNATDYNADATVQAVDQHTNVLCTYANCDDLPDAGCMYANSYGAYHDEFGAAECSNYGGTPCGSDVSGEGCLDANASNYDAAATVQAEDQYGNLMCDYASCDEAPSDGCVYANSFGAYNEEFGHVLCAEYGGTPCGESDVVVPEGEGCMDANASNYDAAATEAGLDQYGNSVCVYAACSDIPDAEGCSYADGYSAYHENFNADNCVSYGGTACTKDALGCIDPNADNFDAAATAQGLDQYGNIACNYSSCDDIPDAEGCFYPENYSAFHDGFNAANCTEYGGTPCTDGVSGCLDANADNYNADATVQALDQYGNIACNYSSCDDIPDTEGCYYAENYSAFKDDFNAANCTEYGGTPCTQGVAGCLDSNATNYNADATVQAVDQWNNQLCVYASCDDAPGSGCMYADSFAGWNEYFGAADCSSYGGTPCEDTSAGCTDANATNYDASATTPAVDQYGNSLCAYASCDDAPSDGCNYTANGSFGAYNEEFGHELCTTYGGTPCGEHEVGGSDGTEGCVDANADNYDADATVQGYDQYGNIACNYSSCDDIPDAEGCYYAENYSAFKDDFNAANCTEYGGTPCTEGNAGCMDSNATNYDAAATSAGQDQWGNSVCIYASCDDIPEPGCIYGDGFGSFNEEFGADACSGYGGTPCDDSGEAYGCQDANASNYDAAATAQAVDQYGNILCVYASCDDIPEPGCIYGNGFGKFNAEFNAANCTEYGGTPCEGSGSSDEGCTDANATNYDAAATTQAVDQYGNILCIFTSCDDIPELGCIYAESFGAYHAEFNGSACTEYGGTPCDGEEVVGCTDANASNFDAAANVLGEDQWGNSVCIYTECSEVPAGGGCIYADGFGTWSEGFGAGECSTYGGTPCVEGCIDANASNYDAGAAIQATDQYANILCTYASCEDTPNLGCIYEESFGSYAEGFGPDNCTEYGGTACSASSAGCTDANASNYDASATEQALDQHGNILCSFASCDDAPSDGCNYSDLGSFGTYDEDFGHVLCAEYGGTPCGENEVIIPGGCMDPAAENYDASATEQAVDEWNNQLCTYASCDVVPSTGCMYAASFATYNANFSAANCVQYGGEACTDDAEGCVDANADNYDADATIQATDQWGNIICTFSSCDAIPDASGCFYATAYSPFHDTFSAEDCVQYGGTACEEDVPTEGPTSQDIDLPSGWSMFSTYLIADDMNLKTVLAPIIDNVIIAKNNEGKAYLVEWDFNGVGEMIVGQGYQIKTDAGVTLTVGGAYATPESHSIDIIAGWNMVGYLATEDTDAKVVLADINASGNLIIAKDYNGKAYLPEWDFNGIGDMVPGQGYQLKTNTADVLSYASGSARLQSKSVILEEVKHFQSPTVTDQNMTVVIEDAAWDAIPADGSEVAAFDQAGNLIGSAVYSSPVTVLSVWGDDATTSSKDGLSAAEVAKFKVWNANEVREFAVKDWSKGSAAYTTNAINVASSINTINAIAELNSSSKELVKVVNILGQEVTADEVSFVGTIFFNIYDDGSVEKIVK